MKFLNLAGVKKLLSKIKEVFTSSDEVTVFENDTSLYVTEIDYDSTLKFDTNWVIGNGAQPIVGQAIVGETILI